MWNSVFRVYIEYKLNIYYTKYILCVIQLSDNKRMKNIYWIENITCENIYYLIVKQVSFFCEIIKHKHI